MAEKIFVTGASGHLGHEVVTALLSSLPASRIVAGARDVSKAADLAERGVEVRAIDYSRPETLRETFSDIDRLLLISSSEIGQRAEQHRNVIDAAVATNVKLLVYTSVLHADRSPLGLAEEHRQTEEAIHQSGIPFALLRNGWYSENYAAAIPQAVEHGVLLGAAGEGRIASATRQDYAEAAAAVLIAGEFHSGKTYELAGDSSYTLSELATEVACQSGTSVQYNNLTEEAYRNILVEVGLPEPLAALLADSDSGAAQGALDDNSHTLCQLIGRPTTPITTVVGTTLAAS
ncbi:MAG: NAD(P)-dependent oxidoreductase [Desulfuromonas sp.]|nr:MAG: NAD(P)-dependent oxidoreductase [Desulfuromonas sp.]